MKTENMIDFLTFTVKGNNSPDAVIKDVLGMDANLFEEAGKGINFYGNSKVYNNIRVNFDGLYADMGVNVSMSGKGCRVYEEYHGRSLISLFKRLDADERIQGTRLDLACDDREGLLDLEVIEDSVETCAVRTRIKNRSVLNGFRGKRKAGKTIYIGSPSSLRRYRAYNKAHEIYDMDTEPELYNSHWVRFELVLRDTYADQAIHMLANTDDVNGVIAGLISEGLEFINLDDSNITRCSLASWWVDFLEGVKSVTLHTKKRIDHTIDEQWAYLQRSYSRFVARVIASRGLAEFMYDIVLYGGAKLTDSDRSQIKDYKDYRVTRYGDLWYGEDFADVPIEFVPVSDDEWSPFKQGVLTDYQSAKVRPHFA